MNCGKGKDEKCLIKETCDEKRIVTDGMNPSIEVIMPPNLTKSGNVKVFYICPQFILSLPYTV